MTGFSRMFDKVGFSDYQLALPLVQFWLTLKSSETENAAANR